MVRVGVVEARREKHACCTAVQVGMHACRRGAVERCYIIESYKQARLVERYINRI